MKIQKGRLSQAGTKSGYLVLRANPVMVLDYRVCGFPSTLYRRSKGVLMRFLGIMIAFRLL